MKPKSLNAQRAQRLTAYNAKWALVASIASSAYAPADTGAPNIITAINASIQEEGNFREALTTYALGWKADQGLEELIAFLTSKDKVAERFEYEKLTNAEAFLSNVDEDLRAPRSEFKSVPPPTSDKVDASTKNRGLQIIVDNKDLAVKGAEFYVAMLRERLLLNQARRAFALLSAGANNTAKTWDTTAGKDPDQDVDSQLVTAADESGIRPNRVLYGETAWSKRRLSHRAQNTAGGFASAAMTPDQLAAHLMVDGVHVAKARYASSASVRSQIVANIVLMLSASSSPSLQDPSNCKLFWSPCDIGGGQFAVYQWSIGSKMTGIAVEHNELLALVSDLGLEKFTVS